MTNQVIAWNFTKFVELYGERKTPVTRIIRRITGILWHLARHPLCERGQVVCRASFIEGRNMRCCVLSADGKRNDKIFCVLRGDKNTCNAGIACFFQF